MYYISICSLIVILSFLTIFSYIHYKDVLRIKNDYVGEECIVVEENNNRKRLGIVMIDNKLLKAETENKEFMRKYDIVYVKDVKWDRIIVSKSK